MPIADSPSRQYRRLAAEAAAAVVYLLAGAAVTVLVAFASAGWVDVRPAAPLTAERTAGDERWEVWRWDRPAATAVLSVRHRGLNWSPRQATGPPDTPAPGRPGDGLGGRPVQFPRRMARTRLRPRRRPPFRPRLRNLSPRGGRPRDGVPARRHRGRGLARHRPDAPVGRPPASRTSPSPSPSRPTASGFTSTR